MFTSAKGISPKRKTQKVNKMTNQAENFIKENNKFFSKQSNTTGYECSYDEIDNNDLIQLISDACTYEEEICGQDTFSFSDGSYITRNEEMYFTGNDVNDFLVTQEMGC